MKYVDEFRDKKLVASLAAEIRDAARSLPGLNIMEVCGTHTMSIFKFGLRDMLPGNIRLISGPGCPVCVTPDEYIDRAIALSRRENIIVATFGDMMRVPGTRSSLERERAAGGEVKAVYSTLDALELARRHPDKEIVFLGVGFETTIPTVAQSILIAGKEGIGNYSVLCAHKTMPAALKALIDDPRSRIDGFLLPGHVSAVTGKGPYRFLAGRGKRCVIAGFESVDILQAILMLIKQKRPSVQTQYTRLIGEAGNKLALGVIKKVFEEESGLWRGMGIIKRSALKIRGAYKKFDAQAKFSPEPEAGAKKSPCICADVIKGFKTPDECRLFGKKCSPGHPVGACMVSGEGTCAAYYKYVLNTKRAG